MSPPVALPPDFHLYSQCVERMPDIRPDHLRALLHELLSSDKGKDIARKARTRRAGPEPQRAARLALLGMITTEAAKRSNLSQVPASSLVPLTSSRDNRMTYLSRAHHFSCSATRAGPPDSRRRGVDVAPPALRPRLVPTQARVDPVAPQHGRGGAPCGACVGWTALPPPAPLPCIDNARCGDAQMRELSLSAWFCSARRSRPTRACSPP